MKITFTILGILVFLGLVAGGGTWAFQHYTNKGDDGTVVRVEEVARGELIELVTAPGQLKPKTKVSISARVVARITQLPFKEGDQVTAGDLTANPPVEPSLLVKLDDKDLQAALDSVQARYAAQEAELTVAQERLLAQKAQIRAQDIVLADAIGDLARLKGLFETGDFTQTVVDDQQAKVDELRAQLEATKQTNKADEAHLLVLRHNLKAAEAEIARAKDNLSYTKITSPIDGLVTKLNAEVGELVMTGTMNNAGTVIMEVADLNTMLVLTRVDESAVARVEKGQAARVRLNAYPGDVFNGVVESVALANTDEKDGSKYYKAEILLQTGGRRIPSGLTADVDIQTRKHEGVTRVPTQSVVGRPVDELPPDIRNLPQVQRSKAVTPVVYCLVDGKSVVKPVEIGPSDLTHTIIKSGLKEGDRVIAGPYKVLESLKHDQKLKEEAPTTRPATQPATQPAFAAR